MFGKRLGVAFTAAIAVGLIGLATWMLPTSRSHAQDAPPQPLPDPGSVPSGPNAPGQEVLTNGPVHEAYAEPTSLNPEPPMVVPKEPPAPVEEMPPDVKPDGQNVVWIPGYWAWDDGRHDFIWVSGIWRDTPPNHAWVAGYWVQANGGFQWTPRIWAPSNVEQVNYVPQPPPSLENGPNVPAPTPNDFWVPGNYEYVNANYAWRAGYWTAAQPDWIWIGAHYVWSPSGYLFIPGHWDYELSHRGVLFAPVAFNGAYWAGRPIVYGPSVVVDPGVLTVDFFVRPNYYHYYFGDCYGPAYVGWGFHPWFSVGVGYDPLFTYYRWYNVRRDPGWAVRVNERFVYMDHHPESRPPRTYALSVRVGAPGGVRIGITLNDYARRPGPTHFQTVSMEQRRDFAREGVRSNEVARQRAIAETHPGGRPGAPHGLDMHEMAKSSGGHLPGAGAAGHPTGTVAERGTERGTERGFENNRGVTTTAARPGTTGPAGAPAKTGTVPGQPSRSPIPSRTPPAKKLSPGHEPGGMAAVADPKKKPDDRGGNGGGGRFLIRSRRMIQANSKSGKLLGGGPVPTSGFAELRHFRRIAFTPHGAGESPWMLRLPRMAKWQHCLTSDKRQGSHQAVDRFTGAIAAAFAIRIQWRFVDTGTIGRWRFAVCSNGRSRRIRSAILVARDRRTEGSDSPVESFAAERGRRSGTVRVPASPAAHRAIRPVRSRH